MAVRVWLREQSERIYPAVSSEGRTGSWFLPCVGEGESLEGSALILQTCDVCLLPFHARTFAPVGRGAVVHGRPDQALLDPVEEMLLPES